MDNEELDGVKFSEFPSQTPVNADEVVGLHSGDNARFSIANIVAAMRQGLASIFVPLTRTINSKALSTDISLDASDVGAVDTADVGVADGVASLDSNGKVPGTQLDLSGKQSTITASGILKGDGVGGVSAATPGTDYQAPLIAGTDYATPDQLEGKANQAQIAYVETGTTASRAYAVGEYFCLNGLLYRVTAAISSGAAFTVGTNCEALTTTDIIRGVDISSEITPSTGVTINRAVAIGKLVAINFTTPKITTANSDIQMGTISQGYRPLSGTSWSGNLRFATASDFGYGHVSVHGNGNIYVTYSKTTSYGLYASIVYYVH